MPSAKTLRVLANPWLHLGNEGIPACACPCDPDEHTTERRFVGAKLCADEVRPADPETGRLAKHRVYFEFSEEPQTLPDTAFYRAAVNSGELIAADADTAKLCGFRKESFRDPKAVLSESRAAARELWRATYDEFPSFCDEAEQKSVLAAEAKAKADASKATETKTPGDKPKAGDK